MNSPKTKRIPIPTDPDRLEEAIDKARRLSKNFGGSVERRLLEIAEANLYGSTNANVEFARALLVVILNDELEEDA